MALENPRCRLAQCAFSRQAKKLKSKWYLSSITLAAIIANPSHQGCFVIWFILCLLNNPFFFFLLHHLALSQPRGSRTSFDPWNPSHTHTIWELCEISSNKEVKGQNGVFPRWQFAVTFWSNFNSRRSWLSADSKGLLATPWCYTHTGEVIPLVWPMYHFIDLIFLCFTRISDHL